MQLTVPEPALVVLIGPSGAGKSTFADRHFQPTEVLSAEMCRALIADDEHSQSATSDAIVVLHCIAARRLAAGRLTVVDATNVDPEARRPLLELAHTYHAMPTAIVFDLPGATGQHSEPLRRSLPVPEQEGFRYVHVLTSVEEVEGATVQRQPLGGAGSHEQVPVGRSGNGHDLAIAGADTTMLPPPTQQRPGDAPDADDVLGKRIISTRLHGHITIRAEQATAARDVISRSEVDPKWLIYLPPTLSPSAAAREPDYLEHPAEAFAYYAKHGSPMVMCQQKHMGSRAVIIVCRDADAARRHFDVIGAAVGVCYTRTGRRCFADPALEARVLDRIRSAMERSELWAGLQTDWVCLDCELLPWSTQAQNLIRQQCAVVGAAAQASLPAAVAALEQADLGGAEVSGLLSRYSERRSLAGQFAAAYRRYCWPLNSAGDVRVVPFHVLAGVGAVYTDLDHTWHMQILERLCQADPDLLRATPHLLVNVMSLDSCEQGIRWWEDLTGQGGEGMVVKPLAFAASGKDGLIQPALKCRGREYLRILYGPEYTLPEHLERLRARGLSTKRSLALREFALGMEALERFVLGESLRRVHECVFGVLGLESEPVDPRL